MSAPEIEVQREQAESILIENLTLAALRIEMQRAVQEGIRHAMSKEAAEEFWSVGIKMLQDQATKRTGRFILDGVWFAMSKGFWVVMAFVALYAVGGWHMVVNLFKVLAGGGKE